MAEELVMVVCPLCGMSRVLDKKGSRALKEGKTLDPQKLGRIRFEVDLDNYPFVDIREAPGGKVIGTSKGKGKGRGSSKGLGFRRIDKISLSEAKQHNDYIDLTKQIKEQILKILDKLK